MKDDTIARLVEEKRELEGDYYAIGKAQGREWSETAAYTEVKEVVEWDGDPRTTPNANGVHESITDMFRRNELANMDDWQLYHCNSHNSKLIKSWIEGVKEIWQEVQRRS